MAKEVNTANDENQNHKRSRSPFNRMLFSDLGADNSEAFVAQEEALDKGGKPVHKYNMSSLGLVRLRTISLCKFLRWKIDWTTADIIMEKIPSYKNNGDYIVKKTVILPYRPGKNFILQWFGQILMNPNKMYSDELSYAFARFMIEQGMRVKEIRTDKKFKRLVAIVFEFTCIQRAGVWNYDEADTYEVENFMPAVVSEESSTEETEEVSEDEIDDSVAVDEGEEPSETVTVATKV